MARFAFALLAVFAMLYTAAAMPTNVLPRLYNSTAAATNVRVAAHYNTTTTTTLPLTKRDPRDYPIARLNLRVPGQE